ncbi:MAG: 1-acyl-sn-glycerol-3-phosphate acyltransferase [Francisellaceae bacterium]|nr:1-acyl-sn-glycerol-3-phosphate acyltransferase [Francisellaceae bacterium]
MTVLFSLLSGVALLLPFSYRYWLITRWSYLFIFLAKWICGLKYRIHNIENIPTGNGIIICNHQSIWETLFMQQLFPPQCMILKKELLKIPFFGWGLACLKPIAINRKDYRSLDKILKIGNERLKQGLFVLLFPEGTRVPSDQNKKFSRTGAVLAKQSGFPLIPVAHNAGKLWPKGPFMQKPGIIDIYIGKPIFPANYDLNELNDLTQKWINFHKNIPN